MGHSGANCSGRGYLRFALIGIDCQQTAASIRHCCLKRQTTILKCHTKQTEPLAVSITRAKALAAKTHIKDGPVLLLDHGDNCMSGGQYTVCGPTYTAHAFTLVEPFA